ncbi:MAG: hypothetical protein WC824_07345, partial [Bacteroidota bacterium]
MPDFNFARGNSKRDEGSSASRGAQQSTGQQRPVSAHPQGGASDPLSATPQRTSHSAAVPAAQGSGIPKSSAGNAGGSGIPGRMA